MLKFFSRNNKPDKIIKTPHDLHSLFEIIQITNVNDWLLYKKAITHPSFSTKRHQNYQQLEFLGDAVLSMLIAEILYNKFPDRDEGQLTKMRSTVVNRKFLNNKADLLGLKSIVKHHLTDKQWENARDILGNVIEALVGAIYLDAGLEEAKRFINEKIINDINFIDSSTNHIDYKSILVEWIQQNKRSINFNTIPLESRRDYFKSTISLDTIPRAEGIGINKKEAEQAAAEALVKKLYLI